MSFLKKRNGWALVELAHLVFVCVAAVVVLGWLVRMRGGDPLGLLRSLSIGLSPARSLGRTLDLAAVLLVAATGCGLAVRAGVCSVAAEGQLALGFAAGCWAAQAFGGGAGGGLAVAAGLLAGTLVGAAGAAVATPAGTERGQGHAVAAGLVFNAVVATALVGSRPLSRPLLFPLVEGWPAPRAALVVALLVFVVHRYVLAHLGWGVALRAATEGRTGPARVQAFRVAGGACGLAGALLALSGHGALFGAWGAEGLGYLALALAVDDALWFLVPVVAVAGGAVISGWAPDERCGLPVTTLSMCLLGLVSFLERPGTGLDEEA